jgi:hypothetical protein
MENTGLPLAFNRSWPKGGATVLSTSSAAAEYQERLGGQHSAAAWYISEPWADFLFRCTNGGDLRTRRQQAINCSELNLRHAVLRAD